MAAVELRPGVSFDAAGFAEFLGAQGDLGTKWSPTYVRIVDAIPVTGTGKLDRKSLPRPPVADLGPSVVEARAGAPVRPFDQ